MKKLFISLLVAIGLVGLATAQTTFRVPASSFKLSADKTGTFIDLSNLTSSGWTYDDDMEMYTKNDLMIPAGTHLMTLGADLPEHQRLENIFFYYDEETGGTKHKLLEIKEEEDPNDYWNTLTITPSEAEQTLLAIPYGSETGVQFMGKKMTGFTIGAGGSVLFTDQKNRISLGQYYNNPIESPEAPYQLPTYSGKTDMLTELVSTYPMAQKNSYGYLYYAFAGMVKGTDAPVRMGYIMNSTDGTVTLIVQFDYLVNYQEADAENNIEANAGDRWIYQFQIKDNDIKLVVKELSITNMKNGAIGFAAYQAGMVESPMGGNTTSYIAVGSLEDEMPCWENPTVITSPEEGCFQITSECAPQSGWTLDIAAPEACPENISGLTDEQVSYADVTATSNTIATNLTFDATKFTAETAAQLGSVVAVLSTSETAPTLEKGTFYAKGDKINGSEIIASTPVIYYDYGGELEFDGLTISALNLAPSTQYYIHLYMMAYQCEGAPMYSTCFKTLSAETGMGAPEVKISGATTEKVTLAIGQPKTYGTVLVKSDTLGSIALTGKVTVGDKVKIGEKEVGEVVAVLANSEKTFELTFDAPGAGAYIHAYTIDDVTAENPTYAADVLKFTAQSAFEQPIGLIDFTEYPSVNRPETYAEEYERPLMPFGWTAEAPLAAPQLRSSFAVEDASNQLPGGLRAEEPWTYEFIEGVWNPVFDPASRGPKAANVFVDAITPPFIAKASSIQAIFEVSFIDPNAMPMADFYQMTANDQIVIEYSLNFGEWQEAQTFTGNDFEATETSHALNVTFECASTDVVRVRYRFKSPSLIAHIITKAEFLDVRDCKTPADLTVVSDKLTNRTATLNWNDENSPKARMFRIEYQEIQTEGEAAWLTQTINRATGNEAEAMEGLLENLKTATQYNYRLTAVCANEESHPSHAQTFATLHTLPYSESLSGTYGNSAGQEPKERGVLFYNSPLGQPLTTPVYIGEGWSYTPPQNAGYKPERTALMCDNGKKNAWLVTPVIYIRELGYNFEQTFSFTLNTLRRTTDGSSKEDGVKTTLADVKLYVLMSQNGTFTINDTLRTFALDQEGFDHATIELPLAVEGQVQLAFLYTCNGLFDDALYECELSNLLFDYDETPCLPVENLRQTATTPNAISLSWQGDALAYGVYWKQTSATEYNETPKVVTETEATIDGLTELTQYDFKVVAYCSEDHSTASEPALLEGSFTTRSCHTPLNFTVEDITATGATFSSTTDQPNFMSKRLVYVTPKAGGEAQIFEQSADKLTVSEVFTAKTAYTAQTRAICGSDSSAMSEAKEFTTLEATAIDSFNVTLTVTPENAGTVTGEGKYEAEADVTIKATANNGFQFLAWINGNDTLSKEATYTFKMPAQDVAYTAVFVKETANEDLLKAGFQVGTQDGRLYVRNLNGITIKDINVYGLTGNLVNRFSPNSREDLILPIDAQRAILFIRLNTEQGVAVYKVYLQ